MFYFIIKRKIAKLSGLYKKIVVLFFILFYILSIYFFYEWYIIGIPFFRSQFAYVDKSQLYFDILWPIVTFILVDIFLICIIIFFINFFTKRNNKNRNRTT